MSDLNPADDDLTTEFGLPYPRAKRRSSILKTRQPLSDLGGCDNDATEHIPNKKSRRVSFSNKPEVREIPKLNYREPILDRETEATVAQDSVVATSSALVAATSSTDAPSRADLLASIQSLLLPPKMFNNQFGIYRLTDEDDFKTILNTNQNKVAATCRANLMGNKTQVFANDAIEMTNCYGNISSAEEGLESSSDIGSAGTKADCTLAQSLNRTKVFGDMSMEMTRCCDGLEGSFTEVSCFDQTMLASHSNEDLELDNDDDDEGKRCAAVSGGSAMGDENSARCCLEDDGVSGRNVIPTNKSSLIDVDSFLSSLEVGRGSTANNAVEDGKTPFEMKSDVRAAKGSLTTAQTASAGGQGMDELPKYHHAATSVFLGLPQERELDQGSNPNRTILLGDDEGDMEMTLCSSKMIADGEGTFNGTIFFGSDKAGMETTHLSKTTKDSERTLSRNFPLKEDDGGVEMNKDSVRGFSVTHISQEGQSRIGRTSSLSRMLKDDGRNSLPTKQSDELCAGLEVNNCVSSACKAFDTNRTVYLSEKMEMTDCMTKTMKLNATVLPPRDPNTSNRIAFEVNLDKTTAFGDDSRNEMSFTECLGKISNNQEACSSQKNVDVTKIFTVEGHRDDFEQTECVQADVFQNATQMYSNWDLTETRVFSESSIDAFDKDGVPVFGKVKLSSLSQEAAERPPLLDVNAFISVLDRRGNSQISGQTSGTAHGLEERKRTFHEVIVASDSAEPAVFESPSAHVPKTQPCQKNVRMVKSVNDACARGSGTTTLNARGSTGVVTTDQPRVIRQKNTVAMVTEAPELKSSSCIGSSLPQDLSLASSSLATSRLMSGLDARLGNQVNPEMVIASEDTPIRSSSSVPGIVSPDLIADPLLRHPGDRNVKSFGDVTDLPWYANPRMPLVEAMEEEEEMDVDVTVNLTQVIGVLNRSRNRSANGQIASILQEDKISSLSTTRVDRSENSTLLTRNSDDKWRCWTSLHATGKPGGIDKSVNERVFEEQEEREGRSLGVSRVDRHESNSLRFGISSQPDDRFRTNEIKRGINKSLSDQALVEIAKDRSRHASLDHLGKFTSTCEGSSDVADTWKLGVNLPATAASKSFAVEGNGKRGRCVDVSEVLLEKQPKRRGVSDADGKDGGTFGDGADNPGAVSTYRDCTSKAGNVAKEMPSSLCVDMTDDRRVLSSEQHLDFDSRTHCLPRPSLPMSTTFANTPILTGKELASTLKLKDITFGLATDTTTASMFFDRSRHLLRLDDTDCENAPRRRLLDVISPDRLGFLDEPKMVAVEAISSVGRSIQIYDSDDECVERTPNRTDFRITSAFNLSRFELPDKWNSSTLDCSEMQVPLPKTSGDLFPTVAPSVSGNDEGEPENLACVLKMADDVAVQGKGQEIASAGVIDVEPDQTKLGSAEEVEPSQTNLGSAKETKPHQTNLGSAKEIESSQTKVGSTKEVDASQMKLGSAKQVEPSQTNPGSAKEVKPNQTNPGSAKEVKPNQTNPGSAKEVKPSQTNPGSAKEVKPNQTKVRRANSNEDTDIFLPKDSPAQMDIGEMTNQKAVRPEIVHKPQKSGMSVGKGDRVAGERDTSESHAKGTLTSTVKEWLSERPENLGKTSTSQDSIQRRPTGSKRSRVNIEETIVFANEDLRRIDEEVKQNLLVKGELMRSVIVSLTEARNQIAEITPADKFSVWDLREWTTSGCSFSFLGETLILDVLFGSEVTGVMFCGKPAQQIMTLTIKSYPAKNMSPECELALGLIVNELFDESVLRLYRDTSQLDKVLHHVLVWILKAERVRKDICDLDPLHIRCRVEIEGHRVTVSYLSSKARVAFTVACDVHLPTQLDTCPEWTVSREFGLLREEDVMDQIKQVEPGFHYLGNVYRRIQTWLDALKARDPSSQ